MQLTDTLLGYIGIGKYHLPWLWYQSHQVILTVLVLQWVEGTKIEDSPQEPS